MLPDFDDDGDLPPGIHATTSAEFETRFATFTTSDRRMRMLTTFSRLLAMAMASGIVSRIVVGGSYVTGKPEPNDIDIVIMLSVAAGIGELAPIQYNVTRRSTLQRLLGSNHLDVIVLRDGSEQAQKAVEFFQTNRDNKQVGVVEMRF